MFLEKKQINNPCWKLLSIILPMLKTQPYYSGLFVPLYFLSLYF